MKNRKRINPVNGPTVTDVDRKAADSFDNFLRPEHVLSEYSMQQLAIEFAHHREEAQGIKKVKTTTPEIQITLKPIKVTLNEAKQLYIHAGGSDDHNESEWKDIHKEIEIILNAKGDRAAGKTIMWWDCWDTKFNPTAFARKIRIKYMGKMLAELAKEGEARR